MNDHQLNDSVLDQPIRQRFVLGDFDCFSTVEFFRFPGVQCVGIGGCEEPYGAVAVDGRFGVAVSCRSDFSQSVDEKFWNVRVDEERIVDFVSSDLEDKFAGAGEIAAADIQR